MHFGFKQFLLNENRAFLSQKIGDILNALQDLGDNTGGMGARQLVKNSNGIVDQIRRILHTDWPQREQKNLKVLQKCGVAIKKAIEEKDDLEAVIQSCIEEIEKLSGDLDMPMNKLASPQNVESPKDKPKKDSTSEPEKPPKAPPQQQTQPPASPDAPVTAPQPPLGF